MKRFLMVLLAMIMIPYVTTLAWTGRLDSSELSGLSGVSGVFGDAGDGKQVLVIRNGREVPVAAEEFLIWMLARQIPVEYGEETLKAQAILARTYLYRELSGGDVIREEALDVDVLDRTQMEKLWGSKQFAENFKKLETAVKETAGLYLTWEGEPIEPFFCRAAAGTTRTMGEERPYLKQVESPGDMEADEFLTITVWNPGTLADRINGILGAAPVAASELPGAIQIVERDNAGYVRQIQVGQKTYTGEEVQYALGLASCCYSFEDYEGKIRATCKGIGHGYGFSQAGANALEREGYDYRELLNYYFQNVEITGE